MAELDMVLNHNPIGLEGRLFCCFLYRHIILAPAILSIHMPSLVALNCDMPWVGV